MNPCQVPKVSSNFWLPGEKAPKELDFTVIRYKEAVELHISNSVTSNCLNPPSTDHIFVSPQHWLKVLVALCSFVSCSCTDMRCSISSRWYRGTLPTKSCKCPGASSQPSWPLPATWTPSTAHMQTTSTEPSSGEGWDCTCAFYSTCCNVTLAVLCRKEDMWYFSSIYCIQGHILKYILSPLECNIFLIILIDHSSM